MKCGEVVKVAVVAKADAKKIKTQLEHLGRLNRGFRMIPCCTASSGNKEDCIAIPVLLTEEEDAAFLEAMESSLLEMRLLHCPYSSARLTQQHQLCSTQPNISGKSNFTLVQRALFETCQAHSTAEQPEIAIQLSIQSLGRSSCPRSLEVLGDDRTLVLPKMALNGNDPAFCQALQAMKVMVVDGGEDGHPTTAPFWMDLWKNIALLHQSPRIVRRGGVDPQSPVRESNYRILWPPLKNNESADLPTGPNDPRWITVTEQGIRQSFDLTRVMFSRGNITEKIRFGKELVRPGEHILDMYGGIGYFTLPALVHGKAAHVTVCEWNPHALQALRYSLRDNHVDGKDRVTVLQGDCRVLATEHRLVDHFDRVSLGLLPSSEGGWPTAVRALRRVTGGWLHVHGNVPAAEAWIWLEWLCVRLLGFVRDENLEQVWLVVANHLEKVKSFAPTVNHYVADVFLGPPARYSGNWPSDRLSLPNAGFAGYVHPEHGLKECRCQVDPPSCALSPGGALHYDWMR